MFFVVDCPTLAIALHKKIVFPCLHMLPDLNPIPMECSFVDILRSLAILLLCFSLNMYINGLRDVFVGGRGVAGRVKLSDEGVRQNKLYFTRNYYWGGGVLLATDPTSCQL